MVFWAKVETCWRCCTWDTSRKAAEVGLSGTSILRKHSWNQCFDGLNNSESGKLQPPFSGQQLRSILIEESFHSFASICALRLGLFVFWCCICADLCQESNVQPVQLPVVCFVGIKFLSATNLCHFDLDNVGDRSMRICGDIHGVDLNIGWRIRPYRSTTFPSTETTTVPVNVQRSILRHAWVVQYRWRNTSALTRLMLLDLRLARCTCGKSLPVKEKNYIFMGDFVDRGQQIWFFFLKEMLCFQKSIWDLSLHLWIRLLVRIQQCRNFWAFDALEASISGVYLNWQLCHVVSRQKCCWSFWSWVCDHTSAWQSWVSADHTGAALGGKGTWLLGGKLEAEFEVKMVPYWGVWLLRWMLAEVWQCEFVEVMFSECFRAMLLQQQIPPHLEMAWGTVQKSLTTLPWLPLPRTEKVINKTSSCGLHVLKRP